MSNELEETKVDVDAIITQKQERRKAEMKPKVDFIKAEQVPLVDWKSENIDKLAKALSKVQGELEGAKKESTNPFFKSSYADLHSVIKSSFPYLSKHGLSISQGNEIIQGAVCVTTLLMHDSGQWLRSKIKLPLKDVTAQGVGACVTYGRRYGLSAIVGIAQYDADGNDC
tara:strand:- start:913 stop:1422 length:510 start_codon:yes stop_codon:yes gene_type:complete